MLQDLCERCEGKEGIHNSDHLFLKIKKVVSDERLEKLFPTANRASPQTPSVPVVLSSQLVGDVTIPDGTKLAPGEKFVKTWKLQNNGSTAWPVGTRLVMIQGDTMGPKSGTSVANTAPQGSVDVSGNICSFCAVFIDLIALVECTAPLVAGRYVSYWRLVSPDGNQFGIKIPLDISVEKLVDSKEQERLENERRAREQQELLLRKEQERQINEMRREQERQRLEQERLERDRAEQERKIQLEREEIARQQAEQQAKQERMERLEQERLEQERLERERMEQERLEQERAEKDRLEKERAEKERLEKEPKFKFQECITQLEEMGFTERDVNIRLLCKWISLIDN